uniref:Uncharacterized protein n=1 Tax=Avena sativa TaxID=4498 RepID=A0ACD5UJI0_AVESA
MMTMKIIILLILLLAPIPMAIACPGVPSLGSAAACLKACGTKYAYDLCINTMQRSGMDPCPSHTVVATVYAVVAARVAEASYEDTMLALNTQLQQNGSLSGDERDAYRGCLGDYTAAESSIERAAERMASSCDLGGLGNEFRGGMMSLEGCRDRLLSPWIYPSPMYPLVMGNRDKVLVAYLLAKLLGI